MIEEMTVLSHLESVDWPTCATHPQTAVISICMTHLEIQCYDCPVHTNHGCLVKQIDLDRDDIRDDLLKQTEELESEARYIPDHLMQRYATVKRLPIPKLCELVAALRAASQIVHCHHCSAEAVGLVVEALFPYCQEHWDIDRRGIRREATLLAFSSQNDQAVIQILQGEISKYLVSCHFYHVSKLYLSAKKQPEQASDAPTMTIVKMLTIAKELKALNKKKENVNGPYLEEVICPLCEETLKETKSEVFWELPCRTATHAICDRCFQHYSFITCPMDGNSFSKSRLKVLTGPARDHSTAQRPILVPIFRAIMKTRYCVTLFSELTAEGWSAPIEACTNLLVFSCSVDVRLLGMAIGVPTQAGQCISIEQFQMHEGDTLVSTVYANPQEIQAAASPISDVYFSHYIRIYPGLRYTLKAVFRGEVGVSLNQGMSDLEETIEGTGEVSWTFERNQEQRRGPIIRLIYERS
jgi:hypothetical protein